MARLEALPEWVTRKELLDALLVGRTTLTTLLSAPGAPEPERRNARVALYARDEIAAWWQDLWRRPEGQVRPGSSMTPFAVAPAPGRTSGRPRKHH